MRRYNLKNLSRFSTVLAASASFGFAACGDDTTPAPADTSTGTDTAPEPDGTTGTDTAVEDTATGTDTVVADPCAPNPCTTPPGPRCDGETVVTSSGTGTCTANGATAACSAYTEVRTDCTGDTPICAGGACVAAGDACDYEFDERVSYVTEIKVVGASDCCFDFGGPNANNDNALGNLLGEGGTISLIPNVNFDVNATLSEQICADPTATCTEAGLVLLLETKGITDVANQAGVTVHGFYGSDDDGDLANNRDGSGVFNAQPASFIEGTATPIIAFNNAKIENGILTAGPSLFTLNIPLLGANLSLSVEETRFEGEVALGPNGKGLSIGGTAGAKLGGLVVLADLAAEFNSFLETTCACIDKTDPTKDYVYVTTGTAADKANFNIKQKLAADSTCTGEGQSVCQSIEGNGNILGLAGGFIAPDIDRDLDGIRESLSIGVRIKGTSGTIADVEMCEMQ